MKLRRRQFGFTLVELLVVMGIISMLLGITLPALSKAKEQARRTVCLSNLKTLTYAWLSYAQDHNGRLVTAGTMDPNSWVNDCTACMSVQGGALYPYLRNPNVYVCPDDLLNYDRTYSINGYLNGEYEAPARTLSDIRSPTSGVFCFIEKYDPTGLNENSFLASVYPSGNWVDNIAPWHQNAGLLSFCDGHAIVWNWADAPVTARTHTPGAFQPGNPDLRQLQAWFGPNPTPPGVAQ